MERYLAVHLPRIVVLLENEMNAVTTYFNQFGPEGGKMSFEQLSSHIQSVTGNPTKISAIRRNDALQYLRSRLGCNFEFEGAFQDWLLVPMPLGWPLPALPPRIIKYIDTIAKNGPIDMKLVENYVWPTGNRMQINVIINAAKFTRCSDGKIRAAYDQVLCNLENSIHKLRIGMLPLKLFLHKLGRNEIQIMDSPHDDVFYDPIQIFKMHINEKAEVRIEKIQTRRNPVPSQVELFVTLRVKKDKSTNTDFTCHKYTNTDLDWFANTRPTHSVPSANDGNQRKLQELREQLLLIIAAEPDGITSLELYRQYRQRFGQDLRTKYPEFCYPLKLIKKLDMLDYAVYLMGAGYMFRMPKPLDVSTSDVDGGMQLVRRRPVLDIGPTLESNLGAVSETFKPVDHIFHLRQGARILYPLCNMFQEITLYCNNYGARVRIVSVRPESSCCIKSNLHGRLAVVLAIMNSEKIKIMYVDYSTEALVSIHAMRQEEADQLPTQAIKGRLENVCPPEGNHWISPSIEEYVNLVRSKILSANVPGWEKNGTVPMAELILIDTPSYRDISIIPKLVDMGLSRLVKSCQECAKLGTD